MTSKKRNGLKIICLNRKASFNYFFSDLLEAGIVLKGSEIKSVRSGKVNIGKPIVKNSSVIGEIKSQFKGPKVKGIRYKNKTRHSVRTGHRQQLTSVEIMDLSKSPAKAKTGSKSKKEDKDGS